MQYELQTSALERIKIKTFGMGNQGINAVNHMQASTVKCVDFFVYSPQKNSYDLDSDLLFLVADISDRGIMKNFLRFAKHAKESNILTVAIIITDFSIDNQTELEQYTDSLIVISDKKDKQVNELTLDIVRGISDLITQQSLIGFDYADMETIIKDGGLGIVGTGTSSGKHRAIEAVENAIFFLKCRSLQSVERILVNISAAEIELFEIDEIGNIIDNLVSAETIKKIGITVNESLGNTIKVTLIATRINLLSSPD